MDLIDRMRELIRSRDYVSFVEFSKLEGAKGPYELMFSKLGNVMLWGNLSEEFCDAYDTMIHDGEMHMVPASLMVYLVDGAGYKLPIAKGLRKYKKKHWLPVTFRPGRLDNNLISAKTKARVAKFEQQHERG